MGNYKFRISDMLPHAWFYKLREMSRTRTQKTKHPTKKKHQPKLSSSPSSSSTAPPPHPPKPNQPHLSDQRKSYYYTRDLTPPPTHDTLSNNLPTNPKATSNTHLHDPPRKSSKKRRSTKRNRASPGLVSAGCSCRATLESVSAEPDSTPDEYPINPLYSSSEPESLLPEFGSDRGLTTDSFDIVIDMDNKSFDAKFEKPDPVSEPDLPPIITKAEKIEERNVYGSLSVKVIKEDIISSSSKEQRISPVRRLSVNSPGVKLRTNSPRIASRRMQVNGRKSVSTGSSSRAQRSLSESWAVVKSSRDPQRDFKESMVEMIMENNIRASKDLEDLLACYLSLNSDEYHDLIIKVFKQIWFDITDIRLE